MLSLLTPTRGRPAWVTRMVESAAATATTEIEFVFYVDDDDPTFPDELARDYDVIVLRGERIVLSEMWNACWRAASGPYFMHCGDDLVFRTEGWDTAAVATIDQYPDRICFAYADDGSPNGREFGTHGFLHANWCDTLGRFVPPYFSSDFNDVWLNEVAKKLGRHRLVEGQFIEHLHPAWGKAPLDATYEDRMRRHQADRPDRLYRNTHRRRREDVMKLRRFIRSQAA